LSTTQRNKAITTTKANTIRVWVVSLRVGPDDALGFSPGIRANAKNCCPGPENQAMPAPARAGDEHRNAPRPRPAAGEQIEANETRQHGRDSQDHLGPTAPLETTSTL
jgi:hypothetical protein